MRKEDKGHVRVRIFEWGNRTAVEMMIEQTEEQMEIQRQIAPNDEWMRFLEGKLLAFRLVRKGFETERGCD